MKLSLQPHISNTYPLGGILIKGATPLEWMQAIHELDIQLDNSYCFAIPNTTANSTWGCLVMPQYKDWQPKNIGRHQYCQVAHQLLFIPEKAIIFPSILTEEMNELLLSKRHFLHPQLGMVELFEPIDWTGLIHIPRSKEITVTAPSTVNQAPKDIQVFKIYELSTDEILQQLEQNDFPHKEKLKDQPLNAREKARLFFLRRLFKQHQDDSIEKRPLLGKLQSLKNSFSGNSESQWSEALEAEYQELERRNQNELDKLMNMLKNDPEKGLAYAIPLNNTGSTRGGFNMDGFGNLGLSKRWGNFSLFGNSQWQGGNGGSFIMENDQFNRLENQYKKTAEELIRQGKYKKAAFVYMKLLKNHYRAAEVLEEGHYYKEAASIYLKHCKNNRKAAECFEKANLLNKAIELYIGLEAYEKVGDLYIRLNQQEQAHAFYKKVITQYVKQGLYVKASILLRDKMDNLDDAQYLLLDGWRADKDAFNCLNNFFSNTKDISLIKAGLDNVHQNFVHAKNRTTFIKVLKYEYKKDNELKKYIRNMAYEHIVQLAQYTPAITHALLDFNEQDTQLNKDVIRYRSSKIRKR